MARQSADVTAWDAGDVWACRCEGGAGSGGGTPAAGGDGSKQAVRVCPNKWGGVGVRVLEGVAEDVRAAGTQPAGRQAVPAGRLSDDDDESDRPCART